MLQHTDDDQDTEMERKDKQSSRWLPGLLAAELGAQNKLL